MQCPVCRADNEEGPQCRRCRADLSLLFCLQVRRERVLEQARQALAEGNLGQALSRAAEADGWRRDDESRQLLALVHLLGRDFAGAWVWYSLLRA